MRFPPTMTTLGSTLILGLVLLPQGCANNPDMTTSDAAGGASPAEEAWMDKHARFNAAIEGLGFEAGVVEVTEPLDGDIDQARQLREEGIHHYQEARYIESIASHAHSVRMVPEFAQGYFGLGEGLLAHGKVDLAVAAHRTAIALDPQFTDARFNLAMALWMLGESAEAVAEMEEVVRQDPQRAAAHERLAIWNYYGGDDEAAWEHVHAAEAVGHQMPGQFLALLAERTPDPGSLNR